MTVDLVSTALNVPQRLLTRVALVGSNGTVLTTVKQDAASNSSVNDSSSIISGLGMTGGISSAAPSVYMVAVIAPTGGERGPTDGDILGQASAHGSDWLMPDTASVTRRAGERESPCLQCPGLLVVA